LDVLHSYRETALAQGAVSILAGATGAVRDAADGPEFAARVKRDLGIEVRILSGREEANLTVAGVMTALSPIPGQGLIFDLGGRSLEFTETKKTEIRQCVSLDLGAVALTEAFFVSDPPEESEIQALRSEVRRALSLGLKSFSDKSGDRPVIGTAGTITTLAAMALKLTAYEPEAVNNFPLKRDILEGLFHHMAGMTAVERAGLTGLPEKRADIIVAGTLAILEIMNFFNINQIITSDAGLLEGLWLAAAKKGGSYD
ncbi:MAG: hypothetical protein JRD68_03830, partial [Deltaproteobacteria bacterium]|nr:hypothetical protein [Deltaproteobacteria bacterium]